MNERPILFKAEMVNAIIEGRKTQTRRILKGSAEFKGPYNSAYIEQYKNDRGWKRICPHGKPGDRLWIRETHAFDKQLDYLKASQLSKYEPVFYHANTMVRTVACSMIEKGRTRPSIFMPRWASRIQLEITDIRVERLNDISEEDCDAEGFGGDFPHVVMPTLDPGDWSDGQKSLPECYRDIWESINGPGSWDSNPFVWVISFKRVER